VFESQCLGDLETVRNLVVGDPGMVHAFAADYVLSIGIGPHFLGTSARLWEFLLREWSGWKTRGSARNPRRCRAARRGSDWDVDICEDAGWKLGATRTPGRSEGSRRYTMTQPPRQRSIGGTRGHHGALADGGD